MTPVIKDASMNIGEIAATIEAPILTTTLAGRCHGLLKRHKPMPAAAKSTAPMR
jgi:hypothetical protein